MSNTKNIQELKIDYLNKLYTESDNTDQEIFAEQRSNILLSGGDHYNKKGSKWWNRIRESRELTNEQKLRLTNNHIHPIVRTYVNNIISQSPGVSPVPNNPKELRDQKAAELNKSVWEYAKHKQSLGPKFRTACKDFIELGECIFKIFWDPSAGRFIGYEQEVDELGQPMVDEMGQPKASSKAVFSGDLVFERVLGFNLFRPAEAKSMDDARWLGIRKMIHLDDLKNMLGDDKEKADKIQATRDETYFVFDGSKSSYNLEKNQALLKEFYFKPCVEAPNGYFYITCQEQILFQGELPYGIFPIIYEGFDEIATTARHRSIIKQLRPYQAEINRAASKIAEHQVTLGDDKVILQNGSKATTGPHLPGVRTMYVTGMAPTVLPGRSGDQYFSYVDAKITEMYRVANLEQEMLDKEGPNDPFVNLYRSIKNKKKFSLYAEKFENFLKNCCWTYLELAKQYFDENMLIPAIGRSEYINIPEFKNQEPLCYQIKLEAISDDIETMMGRHMVLNHVLQYTGSNLGKDDIGKIIRQMPFSNSEEAFSDLTLNYDTATNIILALDRGQEPPMVKNVDYGYLLMRLSARQAQSDYNLLSPQIQQKYDIVIADYEKVQADAANALKAAQADFIPTSGAMIKVDYYVPDPTNKTRSIRATLPAESIDWLIKRISEQGSSQEALSQQTQSTQADIARMLQQMNAQGGQASLPTAGPGVPYAQ